MSGNENNRTAEEIAADRRRFYQFLDDALYISGRLENLHQDEVAPMKIQQLQRLIASFTGP